MTLSDIVEKYFQPHFYRRQRNAVQLPGLILIPHEGRGHYIKFWCRKGISSRKMTPLTIISMACFLKYFSSGRDGYELIQPCTLT